MPHPFVSRGPGWIARDLHVYGVRPSKPPTWVAIPSYYKSLNAVGRTNPRLLQRGREKEVEQLADFYEFNSQKELRMSRSYFNGLPTTQQLDHIATKILMDDKKETMPGTTGKQSQRRFLLTDYQWKDRINHEILMDDKALEAIAYVMRHPGRRSTRRLVDLYG